MIPNTIIHAYTSNLKKMSNIDAQQSFCVRFALFYFPEESSQSFTWDKVFKNGPSKICGKQRLKYMKFLKGCLPQILLGPFLNTLSHLCFIVREWK